MDSTVSGVLNIYADDATIGQIARLFSDSMDCENMKFVVTGKLEYFKNREELIEYIESLDGTVVGSVSKNTSFLICNDKESVSSKMKKAQDLHVPVISEREFILIFGEPDEFDIEEDDNCAEYEFTEIQGESAGDFTINKEKGMITIPFDDTYELLRTADSDQDIIDFATVLINKYTGISMLKFEGTVDSWSSGEHYKFVCDFDGKKTTIKTSVYDEYVIDENLSYEEILERFDWNADGISEDFIDQNRGKTLYTRIDTSVSAEEDLLTEKPLDYWWVREDLEKIR